MLGAHTGQVHFGQMANSYASFFGFFDYLANSRAGMAPAFGYIEHATLRRSSECFDYGMKRRNIIHQHHFLQVQSCLHPANSS
jgi:hypothetical protein